MNFPLYEATFHQHFHMEIISLSFFNVAPIVPVPPMSFQLYYCVSCIVGAACYWQWKYEYQRPAKNSFNIRSLCGGSRQPMMCHFNVYLMLHSTDVAGHWFSPITLVSSTSKSDGHDITEILLKVALNTITRTITHCFVCIN